MPSLSRQQKFFKVRNSIWAKIKFRAFLCEMWPQDKFRIERVSVRSFVKASERFKAIPHRLSQLEKEITSKNNKGKLSRPSQLHKMFSNILRICFLDFLA